MWISMLGRVGGPDQKGVGGSRGPGPPPLHFPFSGEGIVVD